MSKTFSFILCVSKLMKQFCSSEINVAGYGGSEGKISVVDPGSNLYLYSAMTRLTDNTIYRPYSEPFSRVYIIV